MNLIFRQEEEKDYKLTENIAREAFWNLYMPGCNEHFIIHEMRNHKDFIKELSYVACIGDEVVAYIAYTKSIIIDNFKKHEVLTFGPIAVLPKFQRQGIGKQLIKYTANIARSMNYKAIVIFGYPYHYLGSGFNYAKHFNIQDSQGRYPEAHLVFELYENSLNDISGKFYESDAFEVNENELIAFDAKFTSKVKETTESQKEFEIMLNKMITA